MGGTSRRTVLGDVSGAFADLGTFLPLTLGVLALGGLDPAAVLICFGLFALATAAIYRRPVPVQPMKAVAAVALAGGLAADSIVASGLVVGAALTLLAVTGGIEKLSRQIPQSVLAGVQLGIGLHLAWYGLALIGEHLFTGLAVVAVLAGLLATPARPFAAAAALVIGTGVAIVSGTAALPVPGIGIHLPAITWPGPAGFVSALVDVAPGQIALTVTNAVLATAALSAACFPDDADRITPRRLALSTGLLNLALAPLGALPMCHGAGGLAAQYRFGARTWLAPAIFGTSCLVLGVLFGDGAIGLLALVPAVVLGALLAVAGGELAISRRLFDGKPSCLVVILVTGAACVLVNVVIGLVAGMAAEALRAAIVRRGLSANSRGDA